MWVWKFGTDIALSATGAVMVLDAREGRHGNAEQVDTLHDVKEEMAMGGCTRGLLGRKRGTEKGDYVLPLSTFTLEFVYIAACVHGHTASAHEHVSHLWSIIIIIIITPTAHTAGKREERKSTHWTPKSPVLKTSILFRPKHANISTLQRPRPRTPTSFSISSSSLALTSI